MSRRGLPPHVPEPMRASPAIIERCRREIDPPWKAALRRPVNAFLFRLKRLAEAGEGCQIPPGAHLPPGSRLGRYSYVGRGFQAPSPVSVGDLTMISTDVHIVANDHGIDDPANPTRLAFRWRHLVTVFEADVLVGHGAVLRAGVRIGRGAVVGAGAVVVADVEPYCVVGGNPARFIRRRFCNETLAQHDALLYEDA
jgi:chloramphenicol O-acetyltransferase type B